ncbi:hypothetical protein QBC37DRAFT_386176 [Rhypophila decipiens]|uniref:6-methylsalicylate decarboxylase n=1 Tax=Rhypophila decipiens TaxID=261697 RepID=A0AAN6YAR3_9PEZI|nr:hypothetical protein QBC37DRAFT_386176 [Rhypophila decipiens]
MGSYQRHPRIDMHCHAVPPGYRQYAIDNGHSNPDGMPAMPKWTPKSHISLMQTLNITRSILSITSPGTHLTPDTSSSAATGTRQTNEELSAVCKSHPQHFSFFASLPLPDVSSSLLEIDHALDVLDAVGFAVLSNAHGVYLGDPRLDSVFDKLNARKAILFIHPTTCNILQDGDDGQPVPVAVKPQLGDHPRPMMEFMFDETRAIANLLLSGTVEKYPHITYIMSHCGCTLPPIIDRIAGFATLLGKKTGAQDTREEYKQLLRSRFYFDLAGFPFPDQIHGLLRVLGDKGHERLVYGTDYPFTPGGLVASLADELDRGCDELFGREDRERVYVGNAEWLLGLD